MCFSKAIILVEHILAEFLHEITPVISHHLWLDDDYPIYFSLIKIHICIDDFDQLL